MSDTGANGNCTWKRNLSDKRLLFCSVDVVGSTAYKQSQTAERADGECSSKTSPCPAGKVKNRGCARGRCPYDYNLNRWVAFFGRYTSDFPARLAAEVHSRIQAERNPTQEGHSFKLWKCLGDELIFYVEITKGEELAGYVLAFRDTIRKYRLEIQGDFRQLDFKGTAWFCEFPVINRQVQVGDSADFVGAGLDIGFRVAKHSSPERFVVSAEIPYIMCSSGASETFYYAGRQVLKGVLGDAPYPLFWLKDTKSKDETESALITRLRGEDVVAFCKGYFSSNDGIIHPPFFFSGGSLLHCSCKYLAARDAVERLKSDSAPRRFGKNPPGGDKSGKSKKATSKTKAMVKSTFDKHVQGIQGACVEQRTRVVGMSPARPPEREEETED